MARNAVDPCMFCGVPHTSRQCPGTEAPKPAARVTRVPRATPVASPPVTESVQAVPVESTSDEVLIEAPKLNLAKIARVRDPEAELLANAVTLFADADLLHHTELTKHRKIIRLPRYRVDAMIWKQVNNETVGRIAQSDKRSG